MYCRVITSRLVLSHPHSRMGPWIAKRRTPSIQQKYGEIGGGSPIFKWTDLQVNKTLGTLCKLLVSEVVKLPCKDDKIKCKNNGGVSSD